jgi:hypothetical protein
VTATAANTPDRDAAAPLLGEHATSGDKPAASGDSAYGDAGPRVGLEDQGLTVVAKLASRVGGWLRVRCAAQHCDLRR